MNKQILRHARAAVLIAAAGGLLVACGDGRQESDTRITSPYADRTSQEADEQRESVVEAMPEETTMDDVGEEAGQLAETLAAYGADQRDELAQEINKALGMIDQRIEIIEMHAQHDWETLSASSQAKTEVMLEDLRKRREAAVDSYERIEKDSEAAWDELKSGFSEAWTNVVVAVENAEKEFNIDG